MDKKCKNCLYAIPDFRNPKDSIDVLCNKVHQRQRGYVFVCGDFVDPTCKDFIPKDIVLENKNLKKENAELKRLLKLAVEDLNKIEPHMDIYSYNCYISIYSKDKEGKCKWKHTNEVMELIKDMKNE